MTHLLKVARCTILLHVATAFAVFLFAFLFSSGQEVRNRWVGPDGAQRTHFLKDMQICGRIEFCAAQLFSVDIRATWRPKHQALSHARHVMVSADVA